MSVSQSQLHSGTAIEPPHSAPWWLSDGCECTESPSALGPQKGQQSIAQGDKLTRTWRFLSDAWPKVTLCSVRATTAAHIAQPSLGTGAHNRKCMLDTAAAIGHRVTGSKTHPRPWSHCEQSAESLQLGSGARSRAPFPSASNPWQDPLRPRHERTRIRGTRTAAAVCGRPTRGLPRHSFGQKRRHTRHTRAAANAGAPRGRVQTGWSAGQSRPHTRRRRGGAAARERGARAWPGCPPASVSTHTRRTQRIEG